MSSGRAIFLPAESPELNYWMFGAQSTKLTPHVEDSGSIRSLQRSGECNKHDQCFEGALIGDLQLVALDKIITHSKLSPQFPPLFTWQG